MKRDAKKTAEAVLSVYNVVTQNPEVIQAGSQVI